MEFWNPLTCVAATLLVYFVSEYVAYLSKGSISSLIVAAILFIACFWTGIFPKDITTKTELLDVMNTCGIALLITGLGTTIDLQQFIREWKTVAIALIGICAIALIAFTIGSWLFTPEYALTAAPPIAGGAIAGVIVRGAAEAAGRPELAAFAVLVLAFQRFFGLPIATLCLKRDLNRKLRSGDFDREEQHKINFNVEKLKLFKKEPNKATDTPIKNLFKLLAVACIANYVGLATLIPGSNPANYILNPYIAFLVFGLIFAAIGFLRKDTMRKTDSNGLLMFSLMLMLPGSFATISPSQLLGMLPPLVGMLGFSALGIIAVCSVAGKFFGYSMEVSVAIGLTAMFGYPTTQILSNESVAALDCNEEQRERAMGYVLPKMIVAGFTTVTIASVAFAGLLAPIIFQ